MKRTWKLYKNVWISTQPVLPGVWQRKDGGHVVRSRVKECTTGKLREICKVLPEATQAEALAWLEREQTNARAGQVLASSPKMRFGAFADELHDEKIKTGEIKSAKGNERWGHTLVHLIAGTKGVSGFGDFFVDAIKPSHVEKWKVGIGDLVKEGVYAASTANGWLSILRVIMTAAKRRFSIPWLATEDVDDFDTSEAETYTEEEPNSLLPGEVPAFLKMLREIYPQHYAMAFLGFVTGLRPSSLRPLRRRGAESDVVWGEGKLLVRRSQTLGDEVMRTTKQKRRYKWHIDTQLATPEQEDSDLLFPSVTGGFRAPTVLNKPFAEVAATLELGKAFTQRGMRRTFQDLAREAKMADVITRSISGHADEKMQEWYSTVNGPEQRAGISKVIALFGGDHGGDHRGAGGDHKRNAG